MAVVVIGGQCSKVGKTSVACALIAALQGFSWTAIKISPHRRVPEEVSVFFEQDASPESDTGRYLAAGAKRAILISGNVADALSLLREEIQAAEMTLIESNRVLEFIEPDVLLFVVDPEDDDFKESALRWIARSNALLVRSENPDPHLPESIPRFMVGPENWAPAELIEFLREKLFDREG